MRIIVIVASAWMLSACSFSPIKVGAAIPESVHVGYICRNSKHGKVQINGEWRYCGRTPEGQHSFKPQHEIDKETRELMLE